MVVEVFVWVEVYVWVVVEVYVWVVVEVFVWVEEWEQRVWVQASAQGLMSARVLELVLVWKQGSVMVWMLESVSGQESRPVWAQAPVQGLALT
nr:unnamed protein product [Digitaria exilis]